MAQNIYYPTDYATPLFVQGLYPIAFTTTTVEWHVGAARANATGFIMEYTGVDSNVPGTITIDTSVLGANGCYPFAISAVTPVSGLNIRPVYMIGKSSGTTGGSLNSNVAPAMVIATGDTNFVPAGYDVFQEVGFVVINSSGELVEYAIHGYRNIREVMFQDPIQVLNAGNSTTADQIDLSPLRVNGTLKVNLQIDFTPAAVGNILSLAPTGLSPASTYPVRVKAAAAAEQINMVEMPVGYDSANAVPSIDYLVSAAGDAATIYVAGFTYEVPINY